MSSLYSVNAVLLLDNKGDRLYAKYYTPPHAHTEEEKSREEQEKFEHELFSKTHKQNSEITLFDGHLVLYKEYVDCMLFLVGPIDENEAVLAQVFSGLKDALELVINVDKKAVLENYDMVSITVDETIDSGIILEVDPASIASRVSKPPTNEAPSLKNIDLSEKGLFNAWNFAREKLTERLRESL